MTGDTHAVALAHNLLAAFIDNSLFYDNPLGLDPYTIAWPRVVDVNDRALRNVTVGLGGRDGGIPRESSFDIAVASEVMAILALSTSLHNLCTMPALPRIPAGTRVDENGRIVGLF